MSDRNLSDLDPALQTLCQQFLNACEVLNIDVRISQSYRSSAEQDKDYAQGRSSPGDIITNAKGGDSPHNVTLSDGTPAARAFDFYILNPDGTTCDWNEADANWQAAIKAGEALGLISGSTWHSIKDAPHMELPNWRTNPTLWSPS